MPSTEKLDPHADATAALVRLAERVTALKIQLGGGRPISREELTMVSAELSAAIEKVKALPAPAPAPAPAVTLPTKPEAKPVMHPATATHSAAKPSPKPAPKSSHK